MWIVMCSVLLLAVSIFFQAEDGIRDYKVTGVQTCALPICMPATRPDQAPARYAQWMDELRQLRSGGMELKSYDSVQDVARRLMKTNRRLPGDKALWLAHHWAAPNAQGRWEILGDRKSKRLNSSHLVISYA